MYSFSKLGIATCNRFAVTSATSQFFCHFCFQPRSVNESRSSGSIHSVACKVGHSVGISSDFSRTSLFEKSGISSRFHHLPSYSLKPESHILLTGIHREAKIASLLPVVKVLRPYSRDRAVRSPYTETLSGNFRI